MNKYVLTTLTFAAAFGFGFAIGYLSTRKKDEDTQYVEPIPVEKPESKQEPENPQSDILEIKPARLAKAPGETGINYTEYVKELKYKQETQTPPEGDENDISEESDEEEDMSQYEETYEERLERENNEVIEHSERYRREHKGKIELMTSDEWDTDFPETDYDREDLYYFTESDILTDESGNRLDENEYIGPKVRQVGWMQSPDENIYVRNHPKEMEYRIFKERCTVEEWF